MNGNEKVVTISYASDDDTTTGVGVKVFFDSSEMTPSGVKDIYTSDNIASPASGSEEDLIIMKMETLKQIDIFSWLGFCVWCLPGIKFS